MEGETVVKKTPPKTLKASLVLLAAVIATGPMQPALAQHGGDGPPEVVVVPPSKPKEEKKTAPAERQPAPVVIDPAVAAQRAKVRTLQQLLKESGFDPGPIDGISGAKTEKAINSWLESMRNEDPFSYSIARGAIDPLDVDTLTIALRQHQLRLEEANRLLTMVGGNAVERLDQSLALLDDYRDKKIATVYEMANDLFGFEDGDADYLVTENSRSQWARDMSGEDFVTHDYTVSGYRVGETTTGVPSYYFAYDGPVYTANTIPSVLMSYIEKNPSAVSQLLKGEKIMFYEYADMVQFVVADEIAPGLYEKQSFWWSSEMPYWVTNPETDERHLVEKDYSLNDRDAKNDLEENRWRYRDTFKWVDIDLGMDFTPSTAFREVERRNTTVEIEDRASKPKTDTEDDLKTAEDSEPVASTESGEPETETDADASDPAAPPSEDVDISIVVGTGVGDTGLRQTIVDASPVATGDYSEPYDVGGETVFVTPPALELLKEVENGPSKPVLLKEPVVIPIFDQRVPDPLPETPVLDPVIPIDLVTFETPASLSDLADMRTYQPITDEEAKFVEFVKPLGEPPKGDLGRGYITLSTTDGSWGGENLSATEFENALPEVFAETLVKTTTYAGLTYMSVTLPPVGLAIAATNDFFAGVTNAIGHNATPEEAIAEGVFNVGVNVGTYYLFGGTTKFLNGKLTSDTGRVLLDYGSAILNNETNAGLVGLGATKEDLPVRTYQHKPTYVDTTGMNLPTFEQHGAWNAQK
jgi:hypothetical protein